MKNITFVDSDKLKESQETIGGILTGIEYRIKNPDTGRITEQELFNLCLELREQQKEMILGNIKI
jgi:hypothetical protein